MSALCGTVGGGYNGRLKVILCSTVNGGALHLGSGFKAVC